MRRDHWQGIVATTPRHQCPPRTCGGRPSSASAWTGGMGSRGCCHKKKTSSSLDILLLSCRWSAWCGHGGSNPGLLWLAAVFVTLAVGACSFPLHGHGHECQVERCSNEYQKHRSSLDMADHNSADLHGLCLALRSYRHCINKTVGCHGNILYYSIRNYVRQELEIYNCSHTHGVESPSFTAKDHHHHKTTALPPRPQPTALVPALCLYQGRQVFQHCGLFGDPHLRTFNNEFQTCKVRGAWPLVSNQYLTVQVTNDIVHGSTEATATSKLTVIVKGNPECTSAEFQTYQAQANSLPATFEDGRVSVGPYNSLELVELDPGRHVEIHIWYIQTVIVVRQIGRYFTFSIRMPEELVNQTSGSHDLQLCARGCPQSEMINYQEYLASIKYAHSAEDVAGADSKPVMTRLYAEEVCRRANLTDFYFDSCVFDLMATGDENFTLSAVSSMMDVRKLDPSAARTLPQRTTLEEYDKLYQSHNQGAAFYCSLQNSFRISLLLILILLRNCVVLS